MVVDRIEQNKLAEQLFLERLGMSEDDEGFEKHWEMAMRLKKEMDAQLEPRILVRDYKKPIQVVGADYDFNGERIPVSVFKGILPCQISKITIYMVSLNEINCSKNGLLDELYQNMWESAHLDATRWLIGRQSRIAGTALTSFGPGLYNMDLKYMKELFRILDAEKIGVSLSNTMVLSPFKTCGGFFVYSKNNNKSSDFCFDCRAKGRFCEYCIQRKDIWNETNLFYGK